MGFSWQLINDSITDSDKKALTDFINTPNQRFTQGEKVREFEDAWSKYLGCEYSVFVNSGASANYIMTSIMKEEKGLGEVIVSPLGWVSDVSPLVNLGFTPVFVDVDMSNMSISLENIKKAMTKDTVGICLVHVLGFSAINKDGLKTRIVKIDGGMVANNWFSQFLSDTINLKVIRPKVLETTALGVALFAGYQIGEFKSLKEIKDIWQKDRAFSPKIKNSVRNKLLQGWKLAIKKTLA